MKPVHYLLAAGVVALACNFLQGTPAPTAPASTPSRTATPAATQTLEAVPVALDYTPVPRWMILGQPGYDVEILGETWKYADDRWGETYACIDYVREREPYVFFEQCFAMIQEDLTFESQRDSFLSNGFETLVPTDTFEGVENISLLGKNLEDNAQKFVKFFEIVGVSEYIVLVEMNLVTVEEQNLQEFYEQNAADVVNYALRNSLEKSRLVALPTPTPLAPAQSDFYAQLAGKLISEQEASDLYTAVWMGEAEGSIDGAWEVLGDRVYSNRRQVCRIFEDRTNVDVRWVRFTNCVVKTGDFPFEEIAGYYKQPGDVELQSGFPYDDKFVIFGYNSGHTFIDGYLLDGDVTYMALIESRALAAETPEDAFNQTMDEFIHNVFMANLDH